MEQCKYYSLTKSGILLAFYTDPAIAAEKGKVRMWDSKEIPTRKWGLSRDRMMKWRFSRSITITSMSGVGGSTTLRHLRQRLEGQNFRFESGGVAMRRFANELRMSIEDFAVYAREHPEKGYDRKVDEMLRKAGETNGLVMESRLAHGLVPGAMHVLLTCPVEVRARRRQTDPEYCHLSVDEVARLIEERDLANEARYSELYSGHNWVTQDFDLVLSTEPEEAAPAKLVEEIIWQHDKWKARMMQSGIRLAD